MYQQNYLLILMSNAHLIGPPIPPDTGYWIDQNGDYVSDNNDTPILYRE